MFYILTFLGVLLLASIALATPFFLQWIARENIFFTTVREGTVKAIMRGKSFERFIMSFEGHHLNDPDPKKNWFNAGAPQWEIIRHEDKKDDQYDDRPRWMKHLGLYWVGWPWAHNVYVYAFEWNETYTGQSGKEEVLPRAEATDFIYAADFTYAIVTNGAETSDRLQTDELTLVTVAVRNPYRALFSGEDWMRRVTAAINRHVRTYVGEKQFQELISTKDLTGFSKPIIELTEKLPDDGTGSPTKGLHGRYGVVIRTADLQTIELSGDSKKQHEEATTAEYVARQKATTVRLDADARGYAIETIGKKEAEALEARLKVIKDHGEAGITLAGYDAIQESSKGPGNTIVWANNPLGALAGMFKQKGDEK